MEMLNNNGGNNNSNLSLLKVILLIFIPTSILTLAYVIVGHLVHETIPAFLLFFILAMLILFPVQLTVVLRASKKEYGKYSLQSAFSNHQKLSWWKVFIYGALLWGFAGIMSVTIAPLEYSLFAPISDRLYDVLPAYFDWNNLEYLRQYPRNTLIVTITILAIFNIIIGPITEEFFFRGYLTAKISRYGKYAPLIITVLFSLYHLWLPFNNLFRIIIFYPAAYIAWKLNNIYISIVFHCLSNLVSSIIIITGILSIY
jgi:hypothetical protein